MKTSVACANDHLDDLLERICFKLQLTETQQQRVRRTYGAVTDWLYDEDSPLRRYAPSLYAQGSLELDTTVKPRSGDAFDLDAVCELEIGPDADPAWVYKIIWD